MNKTSINERILLVVERLERAWRLNDWDLYFDLKIELDELEQDLKFYEMEEN